MSASLKLTWTPHRPSARLKQSSLPLPLPGSYFLTFISPLTLPTHFYLVKLRNSAFLALSDVRACCQTLRDSRLDIQPDTLFASSSNGRHLWSGTCVWVHVSPGVSNHWRGKDEQRAKFPSSKIKLIGWFSQGRPFFCSCGEAAGSFRFWGAEI